MYILASWFGIKFKLRIDIHILQGSLQGSPRLLTASTKQDPWRVSVVPACPCPQNPSFLFAAASFQLQLFCCEKSVDVLWYITVYCFGSGRDLLAYMLADDKSCSVKFRIAVIVVAFIKTGARVTHNAVLMLKNSQIIILSQFSLNMSMRIGSVEWNTVRLLKWGRESWGPGASILQELRQTCFCRDILLKKEVYYFHQ